MSRLTLLAPVTGGPHDSVTLTTSAMVAKAFDAHVTALFAGGSPMDSVPMVGEGMSASILEQIAEAARKEVGRREQLARNAVDGIFRTYGIPNQDTPPAPAGPSGTYVAADGHVEDVVVAAARLADLSVLARPRENQDEATYVQMVESLLLDSGRPVLLAPNQPDQLAKKVAIAWRGSPDSARAVAMATPFLEQAEEVFVYTVETDRTQPQRADDLAQSLAWRGIKATARTLRPDGAVGATLLMSAASDGVDLLVMGAYGHSRMRELVLGGVTRYMISHAGIPLLMTH